MAKILFIANAVVNFSKYSYDSYYEGFINALTRNGNDVFFLKANLFFDQHPASQNMQVNIDRNKLIQFIKAIDPELIITFNNNITKEILDTTDCPIVFWSSESYDFLVSADLIKKYEPRYLFLHFDDAIRNQFISNLSLDSRKNIITFLSTDIRQKKIKQDKNISFLGTIHGSGPELMRIKEHINTQSERDELLKTLIKIRDFPLQNTTIGTLPSQIPKTSILNLLSRHQRLTTLDALSDLGLHIYGCKKWLEVFEVFPYLSLCYKDGYVCTLDEVSNLYNSSKISINVPHSQSQSFLSYRCTDILASNAVLLNKGQLNKKYDPKGKIPCFNSPDEARQIAIKLLNNPEECKEITEYCHAMAEKNFRFEHRLKELEDLLPVRLLDCKKKGNYTFINPDEFNFRCWKYISKVSGTLINILPKSIINKAYILASPFSRYIPEDLKRMYHNK